MLEKIFYLNFVQVAPNEMQINCVVIENTKLKNNKRQYDGNTK